MSSHRCESTVSAVPHTISSYFQKFICSIYYFPQKPDPVTGIMPYRSTIQTVTSIVKAEGVLGLYSGFPPYYLRCGGHTVIMFMSVAWLRKKYQSIVA